MYATSSTAYKRACEESSNPRGCFMLGMRYANGLVFADPTRPRDASSFADDRVLAARAFRTACDQRHPSSCFKLAHMIMKGGSGIARDRRGAVRLYTKACSLGHAAACANAASLIYHGIGAEKDRQAAELLSRKACDAGQQPACALLRKILREGKEGASLEPGREERAS